MDILTGQSNQGHSSIKSLLGYVQLTTTVTRTLPFVAKARTHHNHRESQCEGVRRNLHYVSPPKMAIILKVDTNI